jgi:hypothetical protein
MSETLPTDNGASAPEVSSSADCSTGVFRGDICGTCGKPWADHPGITATCASLRSQIKRANALESSLAELVAAMHRYEGDVAGECDNGAPPAHRAMMQRAHALLPNTVVSHEHGEDNTPKQPSA